MSARDLSRDLDEIFDRHSEGSPHAASVGWLATKRWCDELQALAREIEGERTVEWVEGFGPFPMGYCGGHPGCQSMNPQIYSTAKIEVVLDGSRITVYLFDSIDRFDREFQSPIVAAAVARSIVSCPDLDEAFLEAILGEAESE